MSEKVFEVVLQQKSGTEAQWNSSSYIPRKSEIIHYTDLNKIKIGDGTNLPKNLPFIGEEDNLQPDWLQATETAIDYIKNKPNIKQGSASYSILEGYETEATKRGAHAEGHTTHAKGEGSHAEGYGTYATATGSHAEGSETYATNTGAHAEGYRTKASGYCSHSEGQSTNAKGDKSHAEGLNTYAVGHYSHAEGNSTDARGSASHTEGLNTLASGNTSHAEGYGTSVFGYAAHVEGYSKNKINEELAEESNENIIGIWTDNQFSLAKGKGSHVEGHSSLALEEASHAEGQYTIASGHWSHSEGYGTKASEQCSHAEGINTIASGGSSHAEGRDTVASGIISHAEGYNTIASGERCHAEGELTIASGIYSHAEGYDTESSGGASHSEGAYTIALGTGSHAEGRSTIAMGYASHVSGKFNVADDQVTEANPFGRHVCIIGNGSDDLNRSNACAVDWNGNCYFAGDVYVNTSSDDFKNPLGPAVMNNRLMPRSAFANFVIEEGVQKSSTEGDSGWHYRKWNNGAVECWRTIDRTIQSGEWTKKGGGIDLGIVTAEASGLANDIQLQYPTKFAFIEHPIEYCSLSNNTSWRAINFFSRIPTTPEWTSTTNYNNLTHSKLYNLITFNPEDQLNVTLSFYVVGRWK